MNRLLADNSLTCIKKLWPSGMGFNRRKLEERREAAEKEAAKRRATDSAGRGQEK
jgi:hypothetical protein